MYSQYVFVIESFNLLSSKIFAPSLIQSFYFPSWEMFVSSLKAYLPSQKCLQLHWKLLSSIPRNVCTLIKSCYLSSSEIFAPSFIENVYFPSSEMFVSSLKVFIFFLQKCLHLYSLKVFIFLLCLHWKILFSFFRNVCIFTEIFVFPFSEILFFLFSNVCTFIHWKFLFSLFRNVCIFIERFYFPSSEMFAPSFIESCYFPFSEMFVSSMKDFISLLQKCLYLHRKILFSIFRNVCIINERFYFPSSKMFAP